MFRQGACFQRHLIQLQTLDGHIPRAPARVSCCSDVSEECVFCGTRLSLTPYLLGLLLERRSGTGVFVLLEMTVVSWRLQRRDLL